MPLHTTPRRPSSALGARPTSGPLLRQGRPAWQLSPYCQPLPGRRRPSSSVAAAAPAERRRASSAAVPPRESPRAPTTATTPAAKDDKLSFLSPDERSVCELMVGLLQHKSVEEARHIIVVVSQMALSRRLLARYSGVYASGCANSDEFSRSDVEEGGRAELIRHLQQQQLWHEEREKKLRRADEEKRERWKKMFYCGDTKERDNVVDDLKRTRRRPAARKLSPNMNARRPKRQGKHGGAEGTATGSGSPNVSRRAKTLNRSASADEESADRNDGDVASGVVEPIAPRFDPSGASATEDSQRESVDTGGLWFAPSPAVLFSNDVGALNGHPELMGGDKHQQPSPQFFLAAENGAAGRPPMKPVTSTAQNARLNHADHRSLVYSPSTDLSVSCTSSVISEVEAKLEEELREVERRVVRGGNGGAVKPAFFMNCDDDKLPWED